MTIANQTRAPFVSVAASSGPLPWAQFWGVVRIETKLQWRQRAWLVGTLPVLLITTLLLLDLGNAARTQVTADFDAAASVTQLLIGLAPMMHIFGLMLYPIMLSDALPKDRQWGVREIINSLPVGKGVYLLGKLMASAISVALSVSIIWGGTGILARVLIGPFHILPFLATGLLALLVVAEASTLLCVLVTAGQPTRRRAIYVAVSASVVTLLLLGIGFRPEISWHNLVNPTQPLTLRYFVQRFIGADNPATLSGMGETIEIGHILLNIAIVMVEIVLGWFIVRHWLQNEI